MLWQACYVLLCKLTSSGRVSSALIGHSSGTGEDGADEYLPILNDVITCDAQRTAIQFNVTGPAGSARQEAKSVQGHVKFWRSPNQKTSSLLH